MLTPLGAMRIAISEAQKGLGFVAPNPPVGCVILDSQGHFLAKGYHHKFGGDHAEIDALKQISNPTYLKDATVYVTLEPCAHEGKTPSCAKHLAKLPIKKVVYGLLDPNPLVSGQGVEILKSAGKEVEEFKELNDELESLAEIFLWNQRQKTPFVTLKIATSLDGQLAHRSGESKWITGEESRLYAHYLRAIHDAVLVGKNTLLLDNPFLNIRHPDFLNKKNKVIVLDTNGESIKFLEKSQLIQAHDAHNIFIVTSEEVSGIDGRWNWLKCKTNARGQIDLRDLLNKLGREGINSILVEGGAAVSSGFLNENLVQRLYQFIAPKILGAGSGVSYTRDVSVDSMQDYISIGGTKVQKLGPDVLITGRFSLKNK